MERLPMALTHKNLLPVIFLIFAAVFPVNYLGAQDAVPAEPVFFPAPPDTPRIQYLTRFSTSRDITGQRSRFVEYIMGKSEEKPIRKPYGIAIRRGKIYICDTMLGGLEIINLKEKTFDYFTPSGYGRLKKPINCFTDESGTLYVADAARRQVVLFDSTGRYLRAVGNPAEMKPTDVAVSGDKIWVSDLENHRILIFSGHTYRKIDSLPRTAAGEPGYLYSPTNLCLAGGRLYVSDMGDFRVKIYSAEGEFLSSVGGFGNTPGRFVRPKGIAVAPDSNLYVADAGFENVQIFNPGGNLLMFFGGTYRGPGDMWLPAKVIVDTEHLAYFRQYVDPAFQLKYLVFVTNQYGPDKISVYGYLEPKN